MTRAIQPQGASMPRTPPRAVTAASAPWRISATAGRASRARGGRPHGLLYQRWCWFRGQPRRWHMRVMIEPHVEVTATLPVCLHLDGRLFVFELDGVPVEISTRNVPNEDGTYLGRAGGRGGSEPLRWLTKARIRVPVVRAVEKQRGHGCVVVTALM